MKKSLKRILRDSILLILTVLLGFLILKAYIRTTYYSLSILYVFYTMIILQVLNLLIDIGRIWIIEKNYKKYIGFLFPIFSSFGIYVLLKNTLSSSMWGITDYTNISIYQEFIDFYQFIQNLFLSDDKLWKMILSTSFFHTIITIIYFLSNKFHGKGGYILERIERSLFTFTPIFLFIILIFQLPYTYYYPRGLQYLSILMLIFIIGTIFYRIFVSLLEQRILNHSSINKETLLVIMNQDNYSSNTIGLFRNPLNYFKYYNINTIINNLVIRTKNYSFVSYDAIRYDLVNLKGYQNIGYIFLIDNKKISKMDSSLLKAYQEHLNLTIKNNKHFVFILLNEGKYTKEYLDKYRYQCIEEIRIDQIIQMIHLTKEDISLHEEVYKLRKSIPNTNRFSYISTSLDKIVRCYDEVEILYSLLKIGEYVVHYRALKNIVENPSLVKDTRSIQKPAFGVWAKLQNVTTTYTSREILVVRDDLIDKLARPEKDKATDEVTFLYLVNLLVTIRNKYIGHGTISNKLARAYNDNLFIIIKVLIEEFKNIDIDLQEDSIISNIFDKDIYAIKIIDNKLYLYMNNTYGKVEYLDYKDGKIFVENTDNKIYLNEEEEEYAKAKDN